jgi:hypothetical protein
MKVSFLPDSAQFSAAPFDAAHPMFLVDVPPPVGLAVERLRAAKTVVVIGIGGSTLPLRVFLDAGVLNDRVKFF